jgi:hypothetical protein
MTGGSSAFRTLIAAAAVGAALLACSERHPATPHDSPNVNAGGPSLSRTEALEIAHAAALREGANLSAYGSPEARYEVLDGKGRWVVFYAGVEEKPGNFFNVLIDDRTRAADILGGE